jgi:hypothetical protein
VNVGGNVGITENDVCRARWIYGNVDICGNVFCSVNRDFRRS